MAKNTSSKGILMQGIGKALSKSVGTSICEYRQFFLSKRLPRGAHADALYYLLDIYVTELQKEKYSPARIQKILYFMLHSINEYTKEPDIPIELYTDMKKIKTFFDDFKEKNEKFDNETIAGTVEAIDQFLTSLRPELTEEDISIAQKMRDKLTDKDKEIEEKDKEIERLKNEFERFSKDLQRDDKYKEKYEGAKKEINNLNEELKKQERTHSKDLALKDEEITELNKTIEDNNTRINDLERKISIKEKEEIRDEKIIKIIYELLSKKPETPDTIIKEIDKRGFFVSNDQLFNYIKNCGLDITKQAYNNHQFCYGFNKYIEQNRSMNLGIPYELSCLFISDLNISNNEIDTYKKIEDIYTYCNNHDIHYIFTLGNIFKINDENNITYEELKNIEKITKEFINNYPKDTNINNIILGGHNEYTLLNSGYNLSKIISNERYDFNTIGNKSAMIKINGGKVYINIHSLYNEKSELYLARYYLHNNLDNPCNLDIIGNNEPTFVNLTNRVISIPPLMSNNNGCTIYQVDISIQDGDYKKFVIQPIMNTEIIPTSRLLLYK